MWIALAGLALSAYGASQTQDAADAQSSGAIGNLIISRNNREKIRKQGQVKADNIMRKSRTLAANQVAKFAANGVVVGDGSAQAIVDETDNLARKDALITLYNSAAGMSAESSRGAQKYSDGMNQASALQAQATTTFLQGSLNAYQSYSNSTT